MSKAPLRVKLMRKAWAKGDAKRDAGLKAPDNVLINTDIPYGKHGLYNFLDVYLPDEDRSSFPVVVNIHGGGYFYGNKELYSFYTMEFAKAGFAVVNFNYRLSPEYNFPAALEDINEVFCWIEQNAAEYKFDLSNLFVIGDSAGAQLSSQYAAMNTNPEYFKLFGFKPHSIKIKGISLACGMYDPFKRLNKSDLNSVMKDYLGRANLDLIKDKLDVLGHITKDYPPTYVFSAYNDFLFAECEPMYNFLKEKGIKTEFNIYGTKENKKIGHVFHENLYLDEGKKANQKQIEFFKALI